MLKYQYIVHRINNKRQSNVSILTFILIWLVWSAYCWNTPAHSKVIDEGICWQPCTTMTDILELGHGSYKECLKSLHKLDLRPIQGHKLVPFS